MRSRRTRPQQDLRKPTRRCRRPARDACRDDPFQPPPVAAPPGVPLADHHAHVDPAPCHRHRAGGRRVRTRVVAACRRRRRRGLCLRRRLPGLAPGQGRAVRVLGGPGLPPAQRHPPHAVGCRLGHGNSRGLPVRLYRVRAHRGADRADLVRGTGSIGMSDVKVTPDYRTPLSRARRLGSAKSGTGHFWWQRVTAVVLALLVPWLVGTLVSMVGADLARVYDVFSRPYNAILMALFVMALFWHAKLGLQVVIEDYVHNRAVELTLLVLNILLCVLGALGSLYAIARIALLA